MGIIAEHKYLIKQLWLKNLEWNACIVENKMVKVFSKANVYHSTRYKIWASLSFT